MRIIKLENIVAAGFDSETGDEFVNLTVEYICENCRHLIEKDDKFCWQCGVELEPSKLVEHYFKDEKLSNSNFVRRVKELHGE